MNNPEPLIAAYLDGVLTDTERVKLNTWLKADAANLRRFTEAVMFEQQIRTAAHATAEQHAAADFDPAIVHLKPRSRWLQWRPLMAAAAGLVIGLFSASMVFGFVVQRGVEKRTPLAVFAPSFENAQMPLANGFPGGPGQWSGDAARVVAAENGVSPKEGKFMLRMEPMSKGVPRIYQVLNLQSLPSGAGGESREIEVSASFAAADANASVRYVIRAFAVTEAPENLDAALVDPREEAIALVTRGMDVMPGPKGWQTFSVKIQVPRAARSLVLFFGVRTPDKAARTSPHYLDDVRVSLITPPPLP